MATPGNAMLYENVAMNDANFFITNAGSTSNYVIFDGQNVSGAVIITLPSNNLNLNNIAASGISQAGAVTVESTGAGVDINAAGTITLDGTGLSLDGTAPSNFTVAGNSLTLSTTTSGVIYIDSAGGLVLSGTGSSNITVTSGNVDIITLTTGNVNINSIQGINLDSDTASRFIVNGTDQDLVLQATGGGTSQEVVISSAGTGKTAVDISSSGGIKMSSYNGANGGTSIEGANYYAVSQQTVSTGTGDTSSMTFSTDNSADNTYFVDVEVTGVNQTTNGVFYYRARRLIKRITSGNAVTAGNNIVESTGTLADCAVTITLANSDTEISVNFVDSSSTASNTNDWRGIVRIFSTDTTVARLS